MPGMPAREAKAEPWSLAAAVLHAWLTTQRNPRALLAEWLPVTMSDALRHDVARSVAAAIAGQRRLEFALAMASEWPRFAAPLRELALVLAARVERGWTTVEQARGLFAQAGGRLDFAVVRRVEQRLDAMPADESERAFALRHSLPDWLAARLLAEFGVDADRVLHALAAEPPRTVRTNILAVPGRDALAGELAAAGIPTSPTRFAPHGLHVHGTADLFATAAYRAGHFEQQDEASQLAATVVAPPPRGRVLDACAGSGGKTLALAALLQNRGEIVACDVHQDRCAALVQRCRRAGASNIRVRPIDEHGWTPEVAAFAARADRILIDAPCSGTGSWRRRPEARWRLAPDDLPALQRTQDELLDRAAGVLAPGARLVYATCSLFAAENEARVAALRQRHPELELVRIAEILGGAAAAPICDPTGTFLCLRPDRHGTDGFFCAVLRRPRTKPGIGPSP